jgi:chromosome segregation ATPase
LIEKILKLTTANQGLEMRISATEDKFQREYEAAVKEARREFEETVKSLQQEVTELTTSLDDSETKNQSLIEKILKLTTANQGLEMRISATEDKFKREYEAAVQDARREFEETVKISQNKVTELMISLENRETKNQALIEQISRLTTANQSLKKRISTTEDKLKREYETAAQEARREFKETVKISQNTITELTTSLEVSETKNRAWIEQISRLTTTNRGLEVRISTTEDKLKREYETAVKEARREFKKTVKSLQQEITECRTSLEVSETKNQALIEQISRLTTANQGLEMRISATEDKLMTMKQSLQAEETARILALETEMCHSRNDERAKLLAQTKAVLALIADELAPFYGMSGLELDLQSCRELLKRVKLDLRRVVPGKWHSTSVEPLA